MMTMLSPVQPVRTLILDDSEDDIAIISRLLSQYEGAEFAVQSVTRPAEAMRGLESRDFDVFILDYSMPGISGVEFMRGTYALSHLPPAIMVTGQSDYHVVTLAVQAGVADCLNKNHLTSRSLGDSIARVLILAEQSERTRTLEGTLIERLAQAATLIEPTISAQGVAHNSLALGRALGLSEREMDLLYHGALAHDIGKLGIDTRILNKTGFLAEEETAVVQIHPLMGAELFGALSNAKEVAPIVRSHHEWWDGSGYPDGLAGEEIPYLARIVSIGDAFDAMVSNRPYRAALEAPQIRHEFKAGAGTQWDARMVEAFLDIHPLLRE